jgi:hypothetical protein
MVIQAINATTTARPNPIITFSQGHMPGSVARDPTGIQPRQDYFISMKNPSRFPELSKVLALEDLQHPTDHATHPFFEEAAETLNELWVMHGGQPLTPEQIEELGEVVREHFKKQSKYIR